MGLETMRGGYGRCPPLLVGGLLVVCLILTCNWWSLSTQNYELVKQIDEIGEQLRRCADERDQSIQLRLSVEGRLKSTEEDLAQLRVRLEQQEISADDTKKQLEEKDADIKKVNKELESSKNSVTMCTTELESLKKLGLSKDEMIASLKVEKDGVLAQREERKKEIEKLKVELSKSTYHQGPSVIVMKAELNAAKVSQPAAPIASGNQVPPVSMWPKQTSDMKVELHGSGLHGMYYHRMPVLFRDPPNSIRPKPRFSVTQLKSKGKPTDTKAKVAAKPADLNADEKDEDNAKERGDEANAVDAVDAEDERFDKNNDDNDGNNIPEENAQEDSVDQMAHAIQEDINEGGVAQPPPVKSANT